MVRCPESYVRYFDRISSRPMAPLLTLTYHLYSSTVRTQAAIAKERHMRNSQNKKLLSHKNFITDLSRPDLPFCSFLTILLQLESVISHCNL